MRNIPATDPTVTPWRPDLAAAHLAGIVAAERYAEGILRQAARGTVPLRGRPDPAAAHTTELLYGERFTVYEEVAGWAWGQCAHDDYVGYVRADALAAPSAEPTDRIAVLRAFLFPAPDVKTPPVDALSLGALVTVTNRSMTGDTAGGAFARLEDGRWIARAALAPLGEPPADPVATALRFLEVPYLWGGRSSLGLDCSGLIQRALAEAGIAAPRDTGMQVRSEAVGRLIAGDGAADPESVPLRRGDVVFFPRHVGLMVDDRTLIHANAHRMRVSLDPVTEVATRIRAAGGRGITAVRRPPPQPAIIAASEGADGHPDQDGH